MIRGLRRRWRIARLRAEIRELAQEMGELAREIREIDGKRELYCPRCWCVLSPPGALRAGALCSGCIVEALTAPPGSSTTKAATRTASVDAGERGG